ncbi:MAG TPA: SdiA-regulated domain-containing protein [Candidatus Polarisedimenticolia bacterium]|nr:SdiA-regulated domain-containing protein [Candidatus Polarisedimenticolia bacterium]
MILVLAAILLALDARAGAAESPPAGLQTRPATVTSLWRDVPSDPNLVRVDAIPGVTEPSALLLRDGFLYTISDSFSNVYRLGLANGRAHLAGTESWRLEGMPLGTDLEAVTQLDTGEVLLADEREGLIFVVRPFPRHVCAVWRTGIAGTCLVGRPNCGVEAMAVVPGRRLFVGREREPRAAYLFDLPEKPCEATTLRNRIYLTLPEEVGPDLSAATFDPVSGHLFIVARSRQRVIEMEVPPQTPGDTSPRPITVLGSFDYARTEDALDYPGLDFHQVEGIAVDEARVLYLVVDNNLRFSRSFGNSRPALLRFFPPTP